MYELLDVVEDAGRRAEAVAEKDRARYEKFIEAGERYAAKHGLIVGGPSATRLLLGAPDGAPATALGSYQYDLYSGQASAHARALGDAMYQLDPDGLGHYTTVLTKVADSLLTVSVDGRDLFTVTALAVGRGVRTADVVTPDERPAHFAKDGDGAPLRLLCAGPELQLIETYGKLCSPAKAADWGDLLAAEFSLRAIFSAEIRAKHAAAVARIGGATPPAGARLRRELRDQYATGPSRVLVGPVAIALLTGRGAGDAERLQVVTAGRLDGDAQEIVAIAKAAGYEVAWKIDDPRLPTAPRLRRMTVHAVLGDRREAVLDVYNAAAYDLVPYVTLAPPRRGGRARQGARVKRGKRDQRDSQDARDRQDARPAGEEVAAADKGAPAALKVGTPFTLMRYRLIDMWTIQVLLRMGVVAGGYAATVLNEMLAGYEAVAAHYEAALARAAHDPEAAAHQLLPVAAYVGRLEEPELALKREAQNRPGARFFPPYYPAARAARAPAKIEGERSG